MSDEEGSDAEKKVVVEPMPPYKLRFSDMPEML